MKGVSAIIAVVLLLIITISMAGFFYLWMQGSVGATQKKGTEQMEKTVESLSSCMQLDVASGNKIYVRNCGMGEIKNTSMSVYVDNIPVNYSLQGNIGESSVGEITLLSDIGPGTHSLKISGVGMGIDENAEICTVNCASTTTSTTGVTTTTSSSTTTSSTTTTTTPPLWLQGWSNRKNVTITNTVGYSLSDYALKINVTYNAKMKADFSDIRFTDTSGNLLGYWMENMPSPTTANMWVKIPSISVSGATIYMYYGNANASSTSNGTNAFDFFDDFTGTTIDTGKWSETDTSGNISQDNRIIISNGLGSWNSATLFSKSTFPRLSVNAYNEFRFNYKAMCQRGSVYPETSMFGWKDSGAITDFANMIHAFYFYKNDGYTERLRIFESGNDRGDHGNWSCGTDYYMKLSLTSSGANYYTSADSETWSLIYTSTGSSETPLKVGFTHYEGGDTYFDNAFVRKYASPEPTYAFGTEEP